MFVESGLPRLIDLDDSPKMTRWPKNFSSAWVFDFAGRRAGVRIAVVKCEALLSSDEARKFGEQLLGAAHEADVQGFLLDWFSKQVGPLDTAQGTAIAMQFRQYVAKQRQPELPADGDGNGNRLG